VFWGFVEVRNCVVIHPDRVGHDLVSITLFQSWNSKISLPNLRASTLGKSAVSVSLALL
jgi:hypothetical protein